MRLVQQKAACFEYIITVEETLCISNNSNGNKDIMHNVK